MKRKGLGMVMELERDVLSREGVPRKGMSPS